MPICLSDERHVIELCSIAEYEGGETHLALLPRTPRVSELLRAGGILPDAFTMLWLHYERKNGLRSCPWPDFAIEPPFASGAASGPLRHAKSSETYQVIVKS